MSDESTRFAHGNPPHQGPFEDPPVWWTELARTDLPDDPRMLPRVRARIAVTSPHARGERAPGPRLARYRTRSGAAPATAAAGHERLGNTMVLIMVVVAAILVTWVGLGDASARGMLVVALLFGIPTAVTLTVVGVVTRRHGG